MDTLTVYKKDADANLNYTFDWSDWLWSAELITNAVFTVETGLTKGTESNTTTTATVTLSGGTVAGGNGWSDPITAEVQETHGYVVSCRVTTNGGQIDDRSILVQITER